VSSIELFNFLRKSLGIIIKKIEEEGVLALLSTRDHKFIPELEVPDTAVKLDLPGSLYKIKVIGDIPVYYNIDRPVTGSEHSVIFPGEYVLVPRIGEKLYLKAPGGFKSRVRIEVLK